MVIDLLFLLTLALGLYKGYRKGLIVSLFSFIGLIIGLAAAFKCSALTGRYISEQVAVPGPLLPSLSFLVTFLIAALLVRLLARMIEKSIKLVMLGWVNQIAGMLLFGVLYTTAFSFVLFFGAQTRVLSDATLGKSATYPYIKPWTPRMMNQMGKLLPFLKSSYGELETFFEGVAEGKKP
jgi:membrane protein required for colicin V production